MVGRRRSVFRIVFFFCILGVAFLLAGVLQDLFYNLPASASLGIVRKPVASKTQRYKSWFQGPKEKGKPVRVAPVAKPGPLFLEKGKSKQEPIEKLDSSPPTRSHNFRHDGLLEVDPDSPHPIYELIQRAEAQWEAKLSSASKTLDEAVAEYQGRYKRMPPLGFDDWWWYCEKHNVQLRDEYDRIHHDLEPFWGMSPHDMEDIQREWEAHEHSYTIGKAPKSILDVVNSTFPKDESGHYDNNPLIGPAFYMFDFMEDIEGLLPPFRAVVSPYDNPNLALDYKMRQDYVKAAADGIYLDPNVLPEAKLEGWIESCPPDSPARLAPLDLTKEAVPKSEKTFIYDFKRSMDPCFHPSHLVQHGQFLSYNKGPIPERKMIPQFSYSPSTLHQDILLPTFINWQEDVDPQDDLDWHLKTDERLLWRGANTGMWYQHGNRWRDAQRSRVASWASDVNGTVTVMMANTTRTENVGRGIDIPKADINPAMIDVFFAGKPLSCAEDTCADLEKFWEFKPMMNAKEAGNYKYVLDVDGHAWSSRFKRLVTSNSLIFKTTVYPEWWLDRSAPWLHYVPVQLDLSDLYDSLFFFRGDIDGEGAHDALARKIALAGRKWSQEFWRVEDIVAYQFRLFLEYGRLLSPDRDALSYREEEYDGHQ